MADNPLSRAVVGLADYLRAHVPSAGAVYDAPTLAVPAAAHMIVTLAPPYADMLGGESELPQLVETTCTADWYTPAAVLETAVRDAEAIIWELALMWNRPDVGQLGGAAAYAIPGETQMVIDDTREDESVWVGVLHTVTVGVRLPSSEQPDAE